MRITLAEPLCLSYLIATLLISSFTATAQTSSSSAPNTPPRATTGGSIKGIVVDEGGRPLSNVHVSMRRVGFMDIQNLTTTTGREGRFEFNALEPVSYQLSAFLPGYAPLIRDEDDGPLRHYRVGDSVKLVLIKGGVITGAVISQTGEPIVGVTVRTRMVHQSATLSFPYNLIGSTALTDDRGIYRIFGLPEGTYVVWAGGGGETYSNIDPFDTDVPTYAPSSTRDTAAEVIVRAGAESNADIRYRGEPGHRVSGSVSGPQDGQAQGFAITLTSVAGDGPQWEMRSVQGPEDRNFVFRGVDDGDYDIVAFSPRPNGDMMISTRKRIKVNGADVTGIELTVQPLSSVSGRVVLEESNATECGDNRRPLFSETNVFARQNDNESFKGSREFALFLLQSTVNADEHGNFLLKNLPPGRYYFGTQFSGRDWYVKSLSFALSETPAAKVAKPIDAARNWTTLKPGDRLPGLTITLAQGAASLHGRLTLREGETLPDKLYVYLVPVEKEKADDPLRFYGAAVTPEGKLGLNHLAPGRYWVLAQATSGSLSPVTKLRLPDETTYRAKLRRDAGAMKTEIELKPCQKVVEFQVPVKLN